MNTAPNSRVNLDRAIFRFAKSPRKTDELRNALANAIVAQMLPQGVVKGGSSLQFRYGCGATRATMDLDTAWESDLDTFLKELRGRLATGWGNFTGDLLVGRQASPKGIPFDYVMQPCDVKLKYLGTPWYTVRLEVGHNEIGDADECEFISAPAEVVELSRFLMCPPLNPIPVMLLEHQVAQKLHGVSAPGSKRAHDLIDLQLIVSRNTIDFERTAKLCRQLFAYRRVHVWPPKIRKSEGWEEAYREQMTGLPVCTDVDEAIDWANTLIEKIDNIPV